MSSLLTVLDGTIVKSFRRQVLLLLQGEPATRFFVVLEGWVRLYRQAPDGQEVTIAMVGKGQSFAETVALEATSFPVSAQLVTDSRLLVIPADIFRQHLRSSSELCLKVIEALTSQVNELAVQLESVSSRSTAQRLASFILRNCPPDSRSCRIELPLDKHLIAARLGMQPETLSRCLAKLRRAGVSSDGNTLIVADTRRLQSMVPAAQNQHLQVTAARQP